MSMHSRNSRRAVLQQVVSAAVLVAPFAAHAQEEAMPVLESGKTESGVAYDVVRRTAAPGDKVRNVSRKRPATQLPNGYMGGGWYRGNRQEG